jgi:hypothetical protein
MLGKIAWFRGFSVLFRTCSEGAGYSVFAMRLDPN